MLVCYMYLLGKEVMLDSYFLIIVSIIFATGGVGRLSPKMCAFVCLFVEKWHQSLATTGRLKNEKHCDHPQKIIRQIEYVFFIVRA